MSRWDSLTPADRLWAKVDKSSNCWLWTGGCQSAGYGAIWVDGRKVLAHRLSYELVVGPIPEGMLLDHKATCPKNCVNPEHLRLATHKQNHENLPGPYVNNTSGYRGVSWWSARKCWKATVIHHGRAVHVGYFTDPVEANDAVVAMRNKLYTHNDLDRATA